MEQIEPTEEDGYGALRGHLVGRALACRAKYGPEITWDVFQAILLDRDFVRFPTSVRFADEGLLPGEFAHAEPMGPQAADGFTLVIRPCYQHDEVALVKLAAYHVPSINYLDIVTHTEAELFGAALLGLEVDAYYEAVCALADGNATPYQSPNT